MGQQAADAWREAASKWLLPQSIIDAAPEPQAALDPEMFRYRPDLDATMPVRPSRRAALEALPESGSVLDVGCGGGASSFGLRSKAGLITGVDRQPDMLLVFEETAQALGVQVRTVLGAWPEVAEVVPAADVAVCHHAFYAAEDFEAHARALTLHARERVVLEMSAHPPLVSLNPLLEKLHGTTRRDWPVADLAQQVLTEMGYEVQREEIEVEPPPREVTPDWVGFVRRRLYVGPDADPLIEEFLRTQTPQPQQVVALWWAGGA